MALIELQVPAQVSLDFGVGVDSNTSSPMRKVEMSESGTESELTDGGPTQGRCDARQRRISSHRRLAARAAPTARFDRPPSVRACRFLLTDCTH